MKASVKLTFIPSRQKVEADIKTFLDEESHKHGFFSDMSDLGKNFLFVS